MAESRGVNFKTMRSTAHGTRKEYANGCRCDSCRAANTEYQRVRKVGSRRIVSARDARKHILALRKLGVGRRAVADACDLNDKTIFEIARRRRRKIFVSTEHKILAVDRSALGDRAYVSARPTWVRLHWMLRQGFTKKGITELLGYKTGALQIGTRRVTARNEMRVEKLFNRYQ